MIYPEICRRPKWLHWFSHDWTTWEEDIRHMACLLDDAGGELEQYRSVEIWQKRTCRVCGYQQREMIR